MKPGVVIVPESITDILRDANITVRDLQVEDLISGEIGFLDAGFVFVESAPAASYARTGKPKQVVHGPQRKGRGGKIRRW